MKKLIKMYRSADPKVVNAGLKLNAYGQLIKIIRTLVCSTGINEVEISKIDKNATKKEVTFTFKTAGNYNHNLGEVVNLLDNRDQEYVIIEITDTFIRCEYYDEYTIESNASYTGKVVNSSLGFDNLSDQGDGTIVIGDEYKVAKYVFFGDKESDNFKNTDQNKVIGVFIQSYNDNSVNAPYDDTGSNKQQLDWALSINPNSIRRGMANVSYKSNTEYTIIGNGNFFYLISGLDSNVQKYTLNAFGTFTSYIPDDQYNALFISKATYNYNQACHFNTLMDSNDAYGKNITNFNTILGEMVNTYNANTLSWNGNSAVPYAGEFITKICHNKQVLRGANSPSGFLLLSSTNFGSLVCGENGIPYPNITNKMFLSDTLIYTGNNQPITTNIARRWTIHGKMPFFYWYGHQRETAHADNTVTVINDNGKIRKFFVHNNSATGSLAYIEITPNAYDNYYRE